jgi:hypothetical protein
MARKKEKICFGQKSVVSARKRQSTDFVGDDVVGESVGGGPRRRRRGVGCSDVRRMLLEVRSWATGRVVCYADCKQDKNVCSCGTSRLPVVWMHRLQLLYAQLPCDACAVLSTMMRQRETKTCASCELWIPVRGADPIFLHAQSMPFMAKRCQQAAGIGASWLWAM